MKIRLFILLALSFAFFGCQTQSVKVPKLPEWKQSTDSQIYGIGDIYEGLAQYAPGAHLVAPADAYFTKIPHAFAEELTRWTWEFLTATGIKYTAESFDCDDFAEAFALAINVSAARAGVEAQPLGFRIFVDQTHEFGGVGAGGSTAKHALNVVYTDRGPYVIEPQPSRAPRMKPLSEYRNLIWEVRIGG